MHFNKLVGFHLLRFLKLIKSHYIVVFVGPKDNTLGTNNALVLLAIVLKLLAMLLANVFVVLLRDKYLFYNFVCGKLFYILGLFIRSLILWTDEVASLFQLILNALLTKRVPTFD